MSNDTNNERKLIEDKLASNYKQLCKAKKELDEARQTLHRKEQAFLKARENYYLADKERAMIDGRHKEIKPTNAPVRKKKVRDLKKEEILEIANKLGVSININF